MCIRLGIIGAGGIGKAHVAAALATGQAVAAVADVKLAHAEEVAALAGAALATNDVAQLLESDLVDAVVVCTPNKWHKSLAIQALAAGKDVLLEKPMGMSAAECREINAAAERSGHILQIGMAYRYAASAQAAARVIAAGDLGQVYHAKAHLYRRRGVPGLGGWFTDKSLAGGGPLIDLGVHLTDLVCWLMDFPQVDRVSGKVYAHFGRRMKDYVYESMWAGPPRYDGRCDVEDSAHALITFADGATFDLQVSWAINMPSVQIPGKGMIGLYGDQGGIGFELFGDTVHVATERHGRNVDTQFHLPKIDHFAEQTRLFAEAVTSRSTPLATGAQGEYVQQILDAIYKSSETDAEVKLPNP